MESPKSSKSDVKTTDASTPKAPKKLYWPRYTRENSPKMCGIPERQEEFGWDDSPEPLKFDPKVITGQSKKCLDSHESPISTHPKRHSKRPPKRLSPSADIDLAVIQELTRKVLSGRPDYDSESPSAFLTPATSESTRSSPLTTYSSVVATSTHSVGTNSGSAKATNAVTTSALPSKPICASVTAEAARQQCSPVQLEEKSFETVLQSFFKEEEDDLWLSQVDIPTDDRPSPNRSKPGFVKSRSDNQLESPGRSAGFRRSTSFQNPTELAQNFPTQSKHNLSTSAFTASQQKENKREGAKEPQPLKKQKSFHDEGPRKAQYSLKEIEKKRLEAKYRREFREIERKRLEAQKRLSERQARCAADLVKR